MYLTSLEGQCEVVSEDTAECAMTIEGVDDKVSLFLFRASSFFELEIIMFACAFQHIGPTY